ncbi:hypothetical protein AB0G67_31150 [Streptomyces sp. NPDC021056]|uniref:hypothetical protein n=1 Tax=Streptomyces sp. NPDC021056 TaxID=3155012 RepID=UPI0033D2E877
MNPLLTARSQGLFNLVGGGWPLLHLRSFEWVSCPKPEERLQRTAAGLLAVSGRVLLRAPSSPDGLASARRTAVGTAVTLPAVDVVYVPRGRIRPTSLLEAAMQAGWPAAWWRCGRLRGHRTAAR